MPSTYHAALLAAVFAVVALPLSASAQETPVSSAIIQDKNTPVSVQACKVSRAGAATQWLPTVTLGNRTKHTLIAADLTLIAYDSESSKIDQHTVNVVSSGGVASRDTAVFSPVLYFNLNAVANNPAMVAKVACRVVAAQFTGDKKWALGQTWPEPLLSIDTPNMTDVGSGGGAVSAARPQAPKFSVSVVNAWVDNQAGVTIVHDTVAVTAGDADVTLHPQDLVLTMSLAGGARKSYYGLAHPAPQYQKAVPGVGTSMVPEVAPASDLGAIGALTIPAHSSATTTVTFLIGDVLQDAADNRAVSAR